MGYRHYFYAAKREDVKKISEFTTNDELVAWAKENGIDVFEGDDPECRCYCSVHNLFNHCVYEFGKSYDNAENIAKLSKPLFAAGELAEQYSEYDAYICEKGAILEAITYYRSKIGDIYEDLMRETSADWPRTGRNQLERMKEHCNTYLKWWRQMGKDCPLDLDPESEALSTSWLYEHQVFDLVRIYKQLDWENYCLAFMGW